MNSREQAKALGLEEHITCSLCQDYLSDAVTLTGCLHFFCRSCLLQHLSSAGPDSRKCPKCKIELGSEHIYKRDLRLQELVYKLVPDLFWRQLRRVARRQHRSSRDSNNGSSTTTASFSERRIQQRRMLLQLSTQLCSPNENISLQIEYVPLTKVLAASGDDSLVSLSEKISATENHKGGENEDNQQILESKLAMSDFYGVYFVDPQLKFVLEDDFSLEDVVQLFSWSRKSPLRLNFTLAQLPPKEDEDRQEVLEDMPQLDMESGQEKVEKEEKLIKEKSVGINEGGKNNIGGGGEGAVQKTGEEKKND
uniref:RING-type domain-containing protein n=1 Tax=Meloidogyne javanica TaxID=6303 RepID=A0A915M5V1_MELJA